MYRRTKPKVCIPLNVVYIDHTGKLVSVSTRYNTMDIDPNTMKIENKSSVDIEYNEESSEDNEAVIIERSTTMVVNQLVTLMNKLVDEGKTYDEALSSAQLMIRDRRDKRKIMNSIVSSTSKLKKSPIPEVLPDPVPEVKAKPKFVKKKKVVKKVKKKTSRGAAKAAKRKESNRRVSFAD